MKRILLLVAALLSVSFAAFAGNYVDDQAIYSTEKTRLFMVNDIGFGIVYAINGPEQMKKSHGLEFTMDFFSFHIVQR